MTDVFMVYAEGICSASVCSSLPKREVNRRMRSRLTGVTPWRPSRDKTFASGEPNPCLCDQNPETHKHYLFHC